MPYTCRRRAGDAKSARRTQANRSSRARTKRFRRQLGGIGGEFFNTPVTHRRYPDNERGIATLRLHRKMANTPSQRDPAYRRNAETIPRGGVVFYRVLRNLREPTGRVDEGGNRRTDDRVLGGPAHCRAPTLSFSSVRLASHLPEDIKSGTCGTSSGSLVEAPTLCSGADRQERPRDDR